MSGGAVIRRRSRVGELVGGTAADCAAVCCCCPLTVMNVVVMVVYRVPTGLCRRVKNKRMREKKKKNNLISKQETIKKALLQYDDGAPGFGPVGSTDAFDDEVWDQFRGAGFWRSPSQRAS